FGATRPAHVYTLSLHDALPIWAVLMRRPEADPSKPPKPRWLRVLLWVGGIYVALNVFALTTMMVQNGSLNGLFPLAMVAGLGWFLYRKFRTPSEDAGESLSDNYG